MQYSFRDRVLFLRSQKRMTASGISSFLVITAQEVLKNFFRHKEHKTEPEPNHHVVQEQGREQLLDPGGLFTA